MAHLKYSPNFFKQHTDLQKNPVHWGKEKLDYYPLKKSARQGDPASELLFNHFLDDLTECVASGRSTPISICDSNLFLIKYAEDVVLFSTSLNELQVPLYRLSVYTKGIPRGRPHKVIFNGSQIRAKKKSTIPSKHGRDGSNSGRINWNFGTKRDFKLQKMQLLVPNTFV